MKDFSEVRLHQLLTSFDSGTHEFCKEERETQAEKKMSFGERRSSFSSECESSRPPRIMKRESVELKMTQP